MAAYLKEDGLLTGLLGADDELVDRSPDDVAQDEAEREDHRHQ